MFLLKFKIYLTQFILFNNDSDKETKFPYLNSATSGEESNGDYGLLGDAVGWFGEEFRDAITDFCIWIVTSLLDFLSPFVIWGCRTIIVWCLVTFYCTKDTKALSTGMKFFLIYLIFLMIRSAFL